MSRFTTIRLMRASSALSVALLVAACSTYGPGALRPGQTEAESANLIAQVHHVDGSIQLKHMRIRDHFRVPAMTRDINSRSFFSSSTRSTFFMMRFQTKSTN